MRRLVDRLPLFTGRQLRDRMVVAAQGAYLAGYRQGVEDAEALAKLRNGGASRLRVVDDPPPPPPEPKRRARPTYSS